ncbi:putative ribonuclease H-like domain-containing protein, partial [Tanacetum coccineum]
IDEVDNDDLYNNLRVYEDELKRSSVEILELVLLVELIKFHPSAHDIAYSFLTQPTTSPQLENEDFQQMDGDDLEELDLLWQSKIECYNCHRKGHFARECRSGRSQGRRPYAKIGRSNAPSNDSSSQALVAQDGLGGYDWSNDFEVELVNYALMAISSSSSSSSSDSEVQKFSKCLQKNYDTEREKHNKAKLEIKSYEISLESLESRIIRHEKNELAWGGKYEFQNFELKCREIKINNLNLELEKAVKERDELKDKISKWEESTKNLEEILKSQMSARDKTGNFLTPRADISFAGLDKYGIRNKIMESQTTELNNITGETAGKTNDANTEKPKPVSESVVSNPKINRDSVIIKDWTSDDEEEVSGVQKVRPKTRDDKSGVSTRTGLHRPSINTARLVSTARLSINTARPVSTIRPSVSTARPSISTARPSVSIARLSVSTTRPVHATRPTYPRVQNMTAVGTRAVVNTGKGKLDTDLKK